MDKNLNTRITDIIATTSTCCSFIRSQKDTCLFTRQLSPWIVVALFYMPLVLLSCLRKFYKNTKICQQPTIIFILGFVQPVTYINESINLIET